MTFLEEIKALRQVGAAEKERKAAAALEEYNKIAATLKPIIQTHLEFAKNEIRRAAKNGELFAYVCIEGGDRPDIVSQETAKLLRKEGLKTEGFATYQSPGKYFFTVNLYDSIPNN